MNKFLLSFCLSSVFSLQGMATNLQCAQTIEGKEDRQRIEAYFEDSSFRGVAVIDFLKTRFDLSKTYKADAGVWEKYTIEQHTLQVMKNFDELWSHHPLAQKARQLPFNVRGVMKFLLALHDIGKPAAIAAGDKNRQHEFTVPMVKDFFTRLHFTDAETTLAVNVIKHDMIGEILKGQLPLEQGENKLRALAQESKVDLEEFVSLQLLFYYSDASAYPSLKERLFTIDQEGMHFKNTELDSFFAKLR